MPAARPSMAVGPVMPGWGSWEWLGGFLLEHLSGGFRPAPFRPWEVPAADVVVVVKHPPPADWAAAVTARSTVLYLPVDHYDSPAAIAADADWLRACGGLVAHCRRLLPHLTPFAPAAYADHPLKFAAPTRRTHRPAGRLLWVGVRSNLPPLVEWVNAHPLPAPLDVLTNPETPGRVPAATEFGFRPGREVRVHEWTPDRHRRFAASARAALDVKGDDFRSRHKPPAKALEFVASGLPIALDPGGSAAEHLAGLGLKVPSPLDVGEWLSERYWKAVRRVGERLTRDDLSHERVAGRFRSLVERAVEHRRAMGAVARPTDPPAPPPPAPPDPQARYRAAADLAAGGDHAGADAALATLESADTPAGVRALAHNDRAVLAAVRGDRAAAEAGFRRALAADPDCEPARANLAALVGAPDPSAAEDPSPAVATPPPAEPLPADTRPVRVAVISLLFNWPTTGGGNVHTAELTKFLAAAGYAVKHLYAEYPRWGIGAVGDTPHPAEAVRFADAEWTAAGVVDKFRRAVDAFDPDWVVLTDSWNMKPVLAACAGGRPYVLRLQALECLCPLNNVRLLPGPDGRPGQCPKHQLATPAACGKCLAEWGHTSGDLHRAERALAGVGTPEYQATLERAFAQAAAVLAVNPLTAAMVEPHAADVRVVTAGMDPARFPRPFPAGRRVPPTPGRLRVLFAGLTREWMKGFHVLRAAADRLWATRQDFEVVATDDPPADRPPEAWARYVGWQSQADLPSHLAGADVVAVPTVAQEALGRTAVEAMAVGRPVVASRLGGLPFTVADGATGLLCRPDDPADLAGKLAALLDDPALRARLGAAGRARFDEHYAWPAVVDRHYRPLFGPPARPAVPADRPAVLVVVAHYAARPADQLVRLLDTMAAHAPGLRYAVRVVVNRDGREEVDLPPRHAGAEVVYRPNAGYNVAAWEAGWRAGPAYAGYLFLQSECRVVRPGWVAAFAAAADSPGVGAVGECLSPDWDAPWPVLAERFRGHALREHAVAGRPAERVDCYLDFFRRHGIPPGERGDHLQTLAVFARRAVLERVGGFPPPGDGYGEAIAAEIGFSKRVQAVGLAVAQVAAAAFEYVEHPQWRHRRVRP